MSRDIPSKEQLLLKALKDLARHYVILMESGRERILFHGGTCDPVDVMERGDPYLRQAREAIAKAEATSAETRTEPGKFGASFNDYTLEKRAEAAVVAGETPAEHPYLCKATRFKMSFDARGRVNSFAGYEKELDGVWVALVYANDDAHMKGYAPVTPKARAQHYGLGDCGCKECDWFRKHPQCRPESLGGTPKTGPAPHGRMPP